VAIGTTFLKAPVIVGKSLCENDLVHRTSPDRQDHGPRASIPIATDCSRQEAPFVAGNENTPAILKSANMWQMTK